MTVLVLQWELHIPGCQSLKEKRTAIRSIKDRLRNKFNVSVAETGYQDVHDRAEITVALVASDGPSADRAATAIDRFVADQPRTVVGRTMREER